MKIWVLVADASRARILQASQRKGPLQEIEDLIHPETRRQQQHLVSDAPGRSYDSAGRGRHAMESPSDPKRHESGLFAKRICAQLAQAQREGRFERPQLLMNNGKPEYLFAAFLGGAYNLSSGAVLKIGSPD